MKFATGHIMSEEVRQKISEALKGKRPANTIGWVGDKHPRWKGDAGGYLAKHTWIYRQLGQPKLCSHCHTTIAKKYEWANISKEYRRDITDWLRLCVSCHHRYDNIASKRSRDRFGRFL